MLKATRFGLMSSCVVLMSSSSAFATVSSATGTINTLAAQDSSAIGADKDYVLVNGFTSAGTCPTSGGLMRIRADAQGRNEMSILLSAYLAGREVTVSVDDAFKTTGDCYLRFVKVN
jgi:hypothetical protein